jgi:hypothetical protein
MTGRVAFSPDGGTLASGGWQAVRPWDPATGQLRSALRMRRRVGRVCGLHPDRFACPDSLVHYRPRSREYGLIVHDGGSSSVRIWFCPWCGGRLPASPGATGTRSPGQEQGH